MFQNFFLVGAGGALGAMLRYGVTLVFAALQWSSNLGIFLVNVVGSMTMGLLMGACAQSPLLLMLTTGLCGGFTTYSTFSMQAVILLQQGKYAVALTYVLATALSCVAVAALGYYLGHRFANP